MINKVIERIRTKYIYVIFLVIYICILLGIAVYEPNNTSNVIKVNGNTLKLKDKTIDSSYISKEDLMVNFPNNIFYDKVSRKLLITTWDDILKIKDSESNIIKEDNAIWYNIDEIAKYFGYDVILDNRENSKYIHSYDELNANVKKHRTEVYDANNNVIGIVDGSVKITILLDESFFDINEKLTTVKITEKSGRNYVGKVEKQSINYENISEEVENRNNKKIVMTTVIDKLSTNTDLSVVNALAVDMLRISSEKTLTEEKTLLASNLNKDIYGIINNGYKLSSFDLTVLSNIVKSDVNKESILNQIVEYVLKKDLAGIVVDFKGFKATDKELVSQFIKELSALLHKNEKSILIKMENVSTYDLEGINNFVDYIIIQAHSTRTVASKVSGSHSTISYVESMLQAFNKNVESSKLILEIAPYSILWTERAGTVINAEVYSMAASTEYIKSNNLKTYYDEKTGQNILNYMQGIITYKMWLEDKTSIAKKIETANNINVAGFAIYRSGYDNQDIYNLFQ